MSSIKQYDASAIDVLNGLIRDRKVFSRLFGEIAPTIHLTLYK